MALMATGAYPTMVEMATDYYLQPGYDFGDEFEFGLELVLDGLERRRARADRLAVGTCLLRGTDRRTGARRATARPSPPRGGRRS